MRSLRQLLLPVIGSWTGTGLGTRLGTGMGSGLVLVGVGLRSWLGAHRTILSVWLILLGLQAHDITRYSCMFSIICGGFLSADTQDT